MRAPDASLCLPDGLSLPGKDPPQFGPDSCSVSAAITHLKAYQGIPLDVAQAITYLRQFDGRRHLHRLYRVYFPLEWSCSTASVSSDVNGGYSPREEEFLRLVERHLFPLDSDYLVDQADDAGTLERIDRKSVV